MHLYTEEKYEDSLPTRTMTIRITQALTGLYSTPVNKKQSLHTNPSDRQDSSPALPFQ